MKQAVLLLFCLGLLTQIAAYANGPSASVDRNPVRIGESVRLVIELNHQGDAQGMDLSPLQQNFAILGRSTSSRINIINGRQNVSTELLLELEPLRTGKLEIPALATRSGVTKPLELEVLAEHSDPDKAREVFLEVVASPDTTWVQAPVTLSVKLFVAPSVSLIDGNLSEPEIKNADIQRLGEDLRYGANLKGVRYSVVERRYVVYPQASGVLNIPPLQFRGQAEDPGAGSFGSLFRQGRRIGARSKPLQLTIKSPPAGFGSGAWLPVSSLELTESWPDDPPVFQVGKPVTRTIKVVAEGATGLQIPDIEITQIPGIRAYPDKPAIATKTQGDRLVGVREQRIAMVPADPGVLELPGIEMKWWDIDENREKVAYIPARSINVKGQLAASPPQPVAAKAPVTRVETVMVEQPGWWPWLTALFALLWLATLGLWWRRPAAGRSRQKASEVTANRTKGVSAIQAACNKNDAAAARAAILNWAKQHFPGEIFSGLDAVAIKLGDARLGQVFREIDASLYGESGGTAWRGESCWQSLKSFVKAPARAAESGNSAALPPLYPGDA